MHTYVVLKSLQLPPSGKKEDWAVSLSSYLTGSTLETYSWMPSEDALDYGKVKVALMKRFQCTEEGYRNKVSFC